MTKQEARQDVTIYYKATCPDGTDFRTGRIGYEVGQRVEHPTTKRSRKMKPNDPSTYLSVSVELGEVLTGGGWPCRLFRIEPVGRTVERTDGLFPFKRGCRALNVVGELPAWMALGPNGQAVAALIKRAGRLTVEEARDLSNARIAARAYQPLGDEDAADDTAYDAAWNAAVAAAWKAAWGAAWNAGYNAAHKAARIGHIAEATAAADAACALVVRDLITPAQFDVLYGPWAKSVKDVSA